MAPEILRYEKYDAKADLWSVGAVLYEMAVGRPPFRAQNHIELLNKIEKGRGVRFADEEAGVGRVFRFVVEVAEAMHSRREGSNPGARRIY